MTVREEFYVTTHVGGGHRLLMWGNACVSDDGEGTLARCASWAISLGNLQGKTVAWIGGGFCIGPRLFAIADCKQTVYEIEPALREFCPEGVEFVAGDYRDTLTGLFDVIVYDLGGEVPRETLSRHINPGGKILPLV